MKISQFNRNHVPTVVAFVIFLSATILNAANFAGPQPELPQLGRQMRDAFYMKPDYINLNHGAYGTHPKVVGDALISYHHRTEQNPDLWLRREAATEMAKVRNLLGKFINADGDDIVMVPNTSTGINAVFRSLSFAIGERILYISTIFSSMRSLVDFISDQYDGKVTPVVFNTTYPMSNEVFLEQFEKWLDSIQDPKRPIKIAIIDHISSMPNIVYPIDKLIPMLKRYNIQILIDGANGIGQVPIDIQKLQPDYYVTNCHKWLFAARGAALLYVAKKHQGIIHPTVISDSYKAPADFQAEFLWPGTPDYTQYLSVIPAVEFRESLGGEEVIMSYTHNLAVEGGQLVASRLGTEVLQSEEQTGSVTNVRLPINNPDDPDIQDKKWFIDIQLYKYKETFCPIYKHNGEWYARISAQIYNDLSDFEVAAKHFSDICNELNHKSIASSHE